MFICMEINPNKLRELRKEEGLKNSDDVFELSDRRGQEIVPLREENSLEKLHEAVREFVEDTSHAFQEAFKLLLEEYKKRKNLPSNDILRYLETHELDKPQFIVAERGEAHFLSNLGFSNNRVSTKQLPVVFQLPKPLAQYWRKGGADSWGRSWGGCRSKHCRVGALLPRTHGGSVGKDRVLRKREGADVRAGEWCRRS